MVFPSGGDAGHVQPVAGRDWASGVLSLERRYLCLHWPTLEFSTGNEVTGLLFLSPESFLCPNLSTFSCCSVAMEISFLYRKKTSTWWSTVAGCLSVGSPTYFRSGAQEFGEPGWWKLVQNRPPTLRPEADKSTTKAKGGMPVGSRMFEFRQH